MNWGLPVVIGVLFATGIYLMLRRNLLKLILGLALISHGANVILISSGWLRKGVAPILGQTTTQPFVDPIPQALILTAIVIGFGTTAFLLVLALRIFRDLKINDLTKLKKHVG